jgi:hypothetical protein
MEDLVVTPTPADVIRTQSPVPGALAWCENFSCNASGDVVLRYAAVTSQFEVVFIDGHTVKLPVRSAEPCVAAAVKFVTVAEDEFYAAAAVSATGAGGLFRVSLQRGGEVVLMFPFSPADFLVTAEDVTAGGRVDRFLEITNSETCVQSVVFTAPTCGMYHISVLHFSLLSGVGSELLRVATPVLVHSCPHRMLLANDSASTSADQPGAKVTTDEERALLLSASWAVRLHHFDTPRRTVAMVSWDSDCGVLEEIREGHSTVFLLRETLFCLSVYSMAGNVLGAVHSDTAIADFAWCRDEHRGWQNRHGGDTNAFYCHVFVLRFDGSVREYAVHV